MGAYPILAYVTGNAEPLTLPDKLREELIAIRDGGSVPWYEEPCVWLDQETMRCKHYDLRPQLCRTALEPGDAKCKRARDYYGVK